MSCKPKAYDLFHNRLKPRVDELFKGQEDRDDYETIHEELKEIVEPQMEEWEEKGSFACSAWLFFYGFRQVRHMAEKGANDREKGPYYSFYRFLAIKTCESILDHLENGTSRLSEGDFQEIDSIRRYVYNLMESNEMMLSMIREIFHRYLNIDRTKRDEVGEAIPEQGEAQEEASEETQPESSEGVQEATRDEVRADAQLSPLLVPLVKRKVDAAKPLFEKCHDAPDIDVLNEHLHQLGEYERFEDVGIDVWKEVYSGFLDWSNYSHHETLRKDLKNPFAALEKRFPEHFDEESGAEADELQNLLEEYDIQDQDIVSIIQEVGRDNRIDPAERDILVDKLEHELGDRQRSVEFMNRLRDHENKSLALTTFRTIVRSVACDGVIDDTEEDYLNFKVEQYNLDPERAEKIKKEEVKKNESALDLLENPMVYRHLLMAHLVDYLMKTFGESIDDSFLFNIVRFITDKRMTEDDRESYHRHLESIKSTINRLVGLEVYGEEDASQIEDILGHLGLTVDPPHEVKERIQTQVESYKTKIPERKDIVVHLADMPFRFIPHEDEGISTTGFRLEGQEGGGMKILYHPEHPLFRDAPQAGMTLVAYFRSLHSDESDEEVYRRIKAWIFELSKNLN